MENYYIQALLRYYTESFVNVPAACTLNKSFPVQEYNLHNAPNRVMFNHLFPFYIYLYLLPLSIITEQYSRFQRDCLDTSKFL